MSQLEENRDILRKAKLTLADVNTHMPAVSNAITEAKDAVRELGVDDAVVTLIHAHLAAAEVAALQLSGAVLKAVDEIREHVGGI